jgi:hypothetical protein
MKIGKIYASFRILSLDVVLGGLASGTMVANILDVKMPTHWYWILPLSIWVMYTADHLLDARRLQDQAHTPRHLFHHRYFKPIFVLWSLGLAVCLSVVPFLIGRELFYFGFFMGFMVLGHLLLVKLIGSRTSRLFHKELGVALIYTFGVWGGPMVLTAAPLGLVHWVCLGQFLLLALVNLLLFSMFEAEIDEMDGHTSFVRAIGREGARNWIWGMALLIVLLAACLLLDREPPILLVWVQLIFVLMLLGLLLIMLKPALFCKREAYRSLGDGVFLLPALIHLVA